MGQIKGLKAVTILSFVKKFSSFLYRYKIERAKYRYCIIDVVSKLNSENTILLHVLVQGIKKEVLFFQPEEIVYDDELLSGFSPFDIRAIMFLSFQKYITKEPHSLLYIEKQSIDNDKTIFFIKHFEDTKSYSISAKNLYQNYELLIKLSKKDMINVISTAVQEQTFFDVKSMESL